MYTERSLHPKGFRLFPFAVPDPEEVMDRRWLRACPVWRQCLAPAELRMLELDEGVLYRSFPHAFQRRKQHGSSTTAFSAGHRFLLDR